MKKQWIAAILAVLMAISCSACDETPQTVPTTELPTTPFEGISVNVLKAEIREEETILQVQWTNKTEYSLMYGEMFGLQKWVDGQWVTCPMKENTGFTTVGYMLEPGNYIIKSYTLRWAFGDLEEGKYRFLTSCSVKVGHMYQDHKLSDDFTLGTESSQLIYVQPPELWLVHTERVQAVKGTYTWNYEVEDSMWNCVNADSSHPLCLKEDLHIISPEDLKLTLEFEDQPDDYTIRCWPDIATVNDDGQVITNRNDQIELKIGSYIYEVTATWNDKGTGHYGTANYIFHAAPSVIPINLETKLYIAGEVISLSEQQTTIICDILSGLTYDKYLICDCQPEYQLTLPDGTTYGIHLEEGYARSDKGQSKLSDKQLEAIRTIIDWALEKTKGR